MKRAEDILVGTSELPFAAYLKAKYRFEMVDMKITNGKATWTFNCKKSNKDKYP